MFYRAVVEDNNHPDKNGQVRVRVHGIHTEKKDGDMNRILSEELPWAEIMSEPNEGLVSGIGTTRVPRKGTYVWVFFDQGDTNKPVIIGSIDGVNDVPANPDIGFNDPDALYPLPTRIGEPDSNRLLRGETTETQDLVIEQLIEKTGTGNDGAVIDIVEPELLTPLGEYTEMEIKETAGFGVPAHLMEIDNTPGNERIRRVHKLGSYDEYRPDGSIIQKALGEQSFYLNEGAQITNIKGDVQTYYESKNTEVIEGAVIKEFNDAYKQAVLLQVDKMFKDKFNHTVELAVTKIFNDTLDEYVKGAVAQTYDDTFIQTITGAVTKVLQDTLTKTVQGNVQETYQANHNMNIIGKQTVVAGDISLIANRIDLFGQVYINGILQIAD